MAMTVNEIYLDVLTLWAEYGFGIAPFPVGKHLGAMRFHADRFLATHDLANKSSDASSDALGILTHAWALLQWYGGMPVARPSHYYDTPHRGDPPSDAPPPEPSESALDSYPLTFSGINFLRVTSADYRMIATTFVDDLMPAWRLDPENMWTDTSTETARYLFETCKQYLLRHGIAAS